MKALAILSLAVFGMFCGGCSAWWLIVMAGVLFQEGFRIGASYFSTIYILMPFLGLGLAWLCYRWIRVLTRSGEGQGRM